MEFRDEGSVNDKEKTTITGELEDFEKYDESGIHGQIISIDGPVIGIKGFKNQRMGDLIKIGYKGLIGEIIKIIEDISIAQCFEYTEGLRLNEPAINLKIPLSMQLGPGMLNTIYDGIQRPLDKLLAESGAFISQGIDIPPLDYKKEWHFTPVVKEGDTVEQGDIFGTVPETQTFIHKLMVPIGLEGKISYIAKEGDYTIDETVLKLKHMGREYKINMVQKWPIRQPRPFLNRVFPTTPLITGMRVIDLLFPVVKGGAVAVPGGFGTGKTVIQHNLAKWADADVIVYIGCGERGNEMADILEEFPSLVDPRTNRPIMERTVLIGNTSNMPVSAREASIFSGLTMAEYIRDMGYHIALLADSTSRWAEALRELSGRLEEMPAEGGYPAYLPTRLANFYERAGFIKPYGSPKREGSITIVGAVSPPSGDFSEPVTKTTKRFVSAFWSLDARLAYSRHYPSINWSDSYSLYGEQLEEWWNKLGKGWQYARNLASELLTQSDQLQNIVQIVGKENLTREQQLVLFTADWIKQVYLIQNAFDEVDRYCAPKKTLGIINIILRYYNLAKDVLKEDVPLEPLTNLKVIDEISKARFQILNSEMDKIQDLYNRLEREMYELIAKYRQLK